MCTPCARERQTERRRRAEAGFPTDAFDSRSYIVYGDRFSLEGGMIAYNDYELSARALDEAEKCAKVMLDRIARVRAGEHSEVRDYIRSNHGRLLDELF